MRMAFGDQHPPRVIDGDPGRCDDIGLRGELFDHHAGSTERGGASMAGAAAGDRYQ